MKRISLSLLLLVLLAFRLSAQSVPSTFNYQGRLTDNSPAQTPVTATVPMVFTIWDSPTGGASQWTDRKSVV